MREISRLKEFLAVAHHGGVQKASQQLGLGMPHVLKVIHDLENEYEVKLFSTHGRGLYLTESGKKFYTFAHQVIDTVEAQKLKLSNRAPEKRYRNFVIVTTPGLMSSILPEILPQFSKNNPSVTVIIKHFTYTEEYDEFDVMIGPKFDGIDRHMMTQKKIKDITFKLYAHKSYLNTYGTPKSRRDLEDHQLIFFAWNNIVPFYEVDNIFQENVDGKKIKPAIVMPCSAGEEVLVKKAGGIGCIYEEWDGASDPEIVNLLPDLKKTIEIFYISKKGGKNHLVKELLNLLVKK